MKINYPRQPHRRRRTILLLGIIAVLSAIVVGAISWVDGGGLVRASYAHTATVAIQAHEALTDATALLTPKARLLRENQELRDTLLEYQTLILENDALRLENTELRTIASTTPDGVVARVIDARAYPYGTMVVLVPEVGAVQVGDTVFYGRLALGSVIEQGGRLATVRLFIAGDNEESVVVGASGAATMMGGSSFGEIQMPRNVPVEVGDVVTLPRVGGKPIGVIADVTHTEEDALQTLLVEVPLNLNLLRFVTLVHE